MPPLVTIGIPTYNRPHFLREALMSAVAQTYPNVEVVVSDNASDPAHEIERVVREVGGGRVKFHRNPTNLGAAPNFLKALEHANGDYFGWLQDDDILFHDFVARGAQALTDHPGAVAYLGFVLQANARSALVAPRVVGPQIPLDWAAAAPRVVPGAFITPLSLLESVALPPAILFRTAAIRRHQHLWVNPQLLLFVERALLAAMARDASVVVAPHVAALYHEHSAQSSTTQIRDHQFRPQWDALAGVLDGLSRDGPADDAGLLAETLAGVSADHLTGWLEKSHGWPADNCLCGRVRRELERVAAARNITFREPMAGPSSLARAVRSAVRGVTPPVVFNGFAHVARRARGRLV